MTQIHFFLIVSQKLGFYVLKREGTVILMRNRKPIISYFIFLGFVMQFDKSLSDGKFNGLPSKFSFSNGPQLLICFLGLFGPHILSLWSLD